MSNQLRQYQHISIERYIDLVRNDSYPYDLVVLTARDAQQRNVFEQQIEMKKLNHTIPNSLEFIVISDRLGTIGSGTATLHVLEDLKNQYFGSLSKLEQSRVLLIHCGGFSKRLPHHSTLGKVFAPLPFQVEGSMWSMLEMKLAMFVSVGTGFQNLNSGGIMVTCADDICIYDNDFVLSSMATMQPTGFVAFAHPSPIHIGEMHGVFVLPQNEVLPDGNVVCNCTKFIHKPSAEKMRINGAIHGDTVFTDSSYFFFPDVIELLLKFSENNPVIPVELDCYGDFLCALGTDSNTEYINSNSSKSVFQKQLYDLLVNTSFNVFCCRPSKFYHIGTMAEYIEHFAVDIHHNSFMYEINGQKNVVSYMDSPPLPVDSNFLQTIILGAEPVRSRFESRTVIENCFFSFSPDQPHLTIASDSIFSNVDIVESDLIALCIQKNISLDILHISDHIYLQTIPIRYKNERKFMTFVVGTDDDLKKQSNWTCVQMFGVSNVAECLKPNLLPSDIWTQRQISESTCSIWDAKLFPVTDTPLESVLYALAIAKASKQSLDNLNIREFDRISFGECLIIGDTEYQLQRLFELHDRVTVLTINNLFNSKHDVSMWATQHAHIFATLKRKMRTTSTDEFYNFLINGLCRHDMDALELMRMKRSIAYFISNSFFGYVPEQSKLEHDSFIIRLVKESESVLRNLLCAPFIPPQFDEKHLYTVPRMIHGISTRNIQSVSVELPVRINLAGGWTDTPPYCLTHGGTVLNMSLLVNNRNPVKATAIIFPSEKYMFRFVIEDDDERIETEVTDMTELFTISPNEQFGIHKSVTAFTLFPGLCALSETERQHMDMDKKMLHFFQHLSDRCVGIELCTKVSGIPRGSGLGTSSILIVASVEALRQVLINDHDPEHMITPKYYDNILKQESRSHFYDMVNMGLAIEQVLSTGGGWQDQIGGMVSGLKLIESEPINLKNCDNKITPALTYSITPIPLDPDRLQEFNKRMLVVFTGRQRLAKGVLTNVVENHIVSIGKTNDTLEELKVVTKNMAQAMGQFFSDKEHNETLLEQIGSHLSHVRDLNIRLSLSTSHSMGPLFDKINDMTYGTCMIGAGSGGYILGILKSEFTKQDALNRLNEDFPDVMLCDASLE
jgi:galactokinase/mevalonate kinase-like predicted kinase